MASVAHVEKKKVHPERSTDVSCRVAVAALGAPESHFAWQVQHWKHLSCVLRLRGNTINTTPSTLAVMGMLSSPPSSSLGSIDSTDALLRVFQQTSEANPGAQRHIRRQIRVVEKPRQPHLQRRGHHQCPWQCTHHQNIYVGFCWPEPRQSSSAIHILNVGFWSGTSGSCQITARSLQELTLCSSGHCKHPVARCILLEGNCI